MTQEEFNDWVNAHPEWFQIESWENNRSHKFELPKSPRSPGRGCR